MRTQIIIYLNKNLKKKTLQISHEIESNNNKSDGVRVGWSQFKITIQEQEMLL